MPHYELISVGPSSYGVAKEHGEVVPLTMNTTLQMCRDAGTMNVFDYVMSSLFKPEAYGIVFKRQIKKRNLPEWW